LEEPEAQEPNAEEPKAEEPKADEPKADEPKADEPKAEEPKAEEPKAEEPKADETRTEDPKAEEPEASAAIGAPPAEVPAEVAAPRVETKVELSFPGSPLSGESLRERLSDAAAAALNQRIAADVDNPAWNRLDNVAFDKWSVTLPLPEEQASQVLDRLQQDMESDVVWQTTSQIGGQVSSDARLRAIGAIFVSLIGILAYLWFRFQKAVWGIAAIVALAHDALVMLGGIAISYWLAGPLGFMQVEEFKISLPVIAAFLTLIGFSVNDTIVIFDRIREIRGKNPDVTREMINGAVNQTMSRTILTSGTVLSTVIILYFFGGPGIHAFAFAMVCGVLSGTYSTVFIAAPIVLWLVGKHSSTSNTNRTGKAYERGVA
jgi:SecD/SecF fusion protein